SSHRLTTITTELVYWQHRGTISGPKIVHRGMTDPKMDNVSGQERTRELSMEEALAKAKEQARIKAIEAKVNIKRPPTAPPEDLPSFDLDQPTNGTAQLGGTAYLTCRVKNLNNRAVSTSPVILSNDDVIDENNDAAH
ncbi:unnamed protein product, partial [Nesidiocoris tenuis]